MGSLPHEAAMRNIGLFGEQVLPHLQDIHDDAGWVDRWWPTGARRARGRDMTATIETVDVLDGAWATRVHRAGSGPALVFLAPEEHAGWSPVLDELARSFTVHVPELAGTEEALDELDGLPDLLVYVLDVLDALGLDRVTLVGESFGGMVAAELAAVAGPRVERLVLVAPLGLWRDDLPMPGPLRGVAGDAGRPALRRRRRPRSPRSGSPG